MKNNVYICRNIVEKKNESEQTDNNVDTIQNKDVIINSMSNLSVV